MAVYVTQTPNKYNFSEQTIPFLVRSTLFNSNNLNPVDISFRYIFTIFTLNSLGQYKEFASVAVPARPDNFVGFFDASSIINDALGVDLGTHLVTGATASTKSLVKFRVHVKERYYDSNTSAYITSTELVIGEYYAIEGAAKEGIDPYVMAQTTGTTLPLHHHSLVNKDLILRPNEPMTLSWISDIYYGNNLLNYFHGQYGAFSDPSVGIATYTGITKEVTTVLGTATFGNGDNGCLSATNSFTGSTINSPQISFSFTNLVLEPLKKYKFTIFARTFSAITPHVASQIYCEPIGTNFNLDSSHVLPMSIAQQGWEEVSCTFTTTSGYTSGNITIGIGCQNSTTGDLNDFDDEFFLFDSATLFNISATAPVGDVVIKTNDDTYSLGTGYTLNVVPQDNFNKAKFDTPIGAYNLINPTYQDTTTGLWLSDVTGSTIANYFQVEIYDTLDNLIGQSARIYQKQGACSRYNNLRLKWLNSLGGWDYFTFTKVSSASTEIERDRYKAQPIVGNTYEENVSNIGYRDLQINEMDIITLISDWVGDGTVKWLHDLFRSKNVFLLNPEAFLKLNVLDEYAEEYPVNVTFEEYEYQNDSPESKLKNVVFTISPAINFNEATTNI